MQQVNIRTLIRSLGGPQAVAAWLGVTPMAIHKWQQANRVRPERARQLAEISEWRVEDLCPEMRVSDRRGEYQAWLGARAMNRHQEGSDD